MAYTPRALLELLAFKRPRAQAAARDVNSGASWLVLFVRR
jgi:hypothetical protein